MKIFSVLKAGSFQNPHAQEDYFIVSDKQTIFVVADGVSLDFDNGTSYPKHSGAGEVAKIFCEVVIDEANRRYEEFEDGDLAEIFEIGNKAVLKYNISQGRTKDTINYYDFDLFSATASFLLIKDSKAYWWSLCDSGVAIFRRGEKIFQSPGGWINFPKDWKEKAGEREKIIIRHKDYRNAVDKNGKLVGYGVADGEETAKIYLNTGVLDINAGDLIFLNTDGFENYLDLEEFKSLFKLWPEDIDNQLETIVLEKSKEDPSKYGREKTLIVISV